MLHDQHRCVSDVNINHRAVCIRILKPGTAPRFWKWGGGQILRAKRAENIFDPHFLASGGQSTALTIVQRRDNSNMWDMNYPKIMPPVNFASKSGGYVPQLLWERRPCPKQRNCPVGSATPEYLGRRAGAEVVFEEGQRTPLHQLRDLEERCKL